MGGKLRRGAPKEEPTVCRPNRRLLGETWVGKLEQFFEIPVDVFPSSVSVEAIPDVRNGVDSVCVGLQYDN